MLPTLCDASGAKTPKGIDGISFLPTLRGEGRKEHDFLYWEFPGYGGQQAIIAGEWKAVRQNLAKGIIVTELYDLAADESETRNVAAQHPDVLVRMEKLLKDQHVPNRDFPLPSIDVLVKKRK